MIKANAHIETPFKSVFVANQKRDPSQTTTLRNAFAREMRKRFRTIRGLIRRAIVEEDVFGLSNDAPSPISNQVTPGRNAFNFPRNSQKVGAFMRWLNTQVRNEVLQVTNIDQVGESVESAWTNTYISDSYKRGVTRGRYQMIQEGFDVPSLEETGGIQASISGPIHADRLGLLYTRAFRDLKGITDTMDTQISKVLTSGLAEGENPRTIARKLNATISGKGKNKLDLTDNLGRFIPAERRAEMLARTEVIRTHAQGQLKEFENWGMEGVSVEAEFVHAGDNRVCWRCLEKAAAGPYTLKQAQNIIPVHTLCRCAWSPIDKMAKVRSIDNDVQNDPVARRFRNVEHGRRFLQLKNQYRGKMDEMSAEDLNNPTLVQNIDSDFRSDIEDRLDSWQIGTHTDKAVSLKLRASSLEDTPDLFVKSEVPENVLKKANDLLTDEQYLKTRAVNQAYMEKKGINNVTLYRGTNGPEGERIRKSIIDNKTMQRTQFPMKDNALAGYTDDYTIANGFGSGRGGVTLKNEFSKDDIFVHKDLFSGWTQSFDQEGEYIVIGIDKQVSLNNMRVRLEDGATKDFGTTQF